MKVEKINRYFDKGLENRGKHDEEYNELMEVIELQKDIGRTIAADYKKYKAKLDKMERLNYVTIDEKEYKRNTKTFKNELQRIKNIIEYIENL